MLLNIVVDVYEGERGGLRSVQLLTAMSGVRAQQYFYLLVGSYTNSGNLGDNPILDSSGSKGIYVYRFDAMTGAVKLLSHTEGVCNPSYLALAPDGRHIYACTESRMKGMGSVSAFEFDRIRGRLRFVNKVPSGGDNPAYLSVDSSGRWVVVANYTGGSFSVCRIRLDGGVEPASQRLAFEGHGVNPQRQDKSHVHSAVFSPDMRHLYIQDLGLDRMSDYRFNAGADMPLDTVGVRRYASVPGVGPRHLVFGPDGHYAYLVEEMGGAVDVYRYDASTGGLDSVQRIAAHPDTATGSWRSADIHLTPDGRFLYTSNRAESTITIFAVDRESGTLKRMGYASTLGKEPRYFTIDPTGNWLLVADQESNMVVIFRIDRVTGALIPSESRIRAHLPTYLRMMR